MGKMAREKKMRGQLDTLAVSRRCQRRRPPPALRSRFAWCTPKPSVKTFVPSLSLSPTSLLQTKTHKVVASYLAVRNLVLSASAGGGGTLLELLLGLGGFDSTRFRYKYRAGRSTRGLGRARAPSELGTRGRGRDRLRHGAGRLDEAPDFQILELIRD